MFGRACGPAPATNQGNSNSRIRSGLPVGRRGGSGCGGRCKYVHVSSVAACSCALSCAHGKTGVGRPAQPARGMPRAHAAHAPATGPTPPSTVLRDLSALLSVDPRHAWMLFVQLSKYSNSMEIHPRMAWIYQIAEICQRWGGVGVRGVSRMDAAAKPTWRVQGRRPCRPTPYLAAAICSSMSAAVTGPRKLCASLPCGSMRWVNGKPRGVAKSAGGS